MKRDAVSEFTRNVVALGEMEHETAELFEPAGRVFGYRVMSLEPQLQGILSDGIPLQLPTENGKGRLLVPHL